MSSELLLPDCSMTQWYLTSHFPLDCAGPSSGAGRRVQDEVCATRRVTVIPPAEWRPFWVDAEVRGVIG